MNYRTDVARVLKEEYSPEDGALAMSALRGDRFCARWCAVCGYHPALFVFALCLVRLCPKCTARRIAHLRGQGHPIPDGPGPSQRIREAAKGSRTPILALLGFLEWEALSQVQAQDRHEREELEVHFDTFVRCTRCSRLIPGRSARYARGPDGVGAPPCCEACWEQRSGTA